MAMTGSMACDVSQQYATLAGSMAWTNFQVREQSCRTGSDLLC